MIRLATVVGSRTNILPHFLKYYSNIVDEIYIGVYEWEEKSIISEIREIVAQFPKARIVCQETHDKYNWSAVTFMYNTIKYMHPNDWWVVADDDEFHLYSQFLDTIIEDCEHNGWDLVRGGFVDRIGPDGTFPVITDDKPILDQFPLSGFFRYPLSGACPNKVCIMKGYIELTPGQHYAKIDGHTTWRWQGWNHPMIAPTNRYYVQVHHLKWDSTCIERIKDVADTSTPWSFSKEYQLMYDALKENDFKIDITNPNFRFEEAGPWGYNHYNWNKVWNLIQSI
jgi:hypothetical protein